MPTVIQAAFPRDVRHTRLLWPGRTIGRGASGRRSDCPPGGPDRQTTARRGRVWFWGTGFGSRAKSRIWFDV